MIKLFLISAWRNIKRNPVISLIHTLGFSIALGCSLVTFQFMEFHFTTDNYHKHGDEVFMVALTSERSGNHKLWHFAPVPLGPELKRNFEQVEAMTWIIRESLPVKHNGELINQPALFVNDDFFTMFTFPLKHGSIRQFSEAQGAVISSATALKYFGKDDPVGEVLVFSTEGTQEMAFTVIGVLDEIPRNSSFIPDILLPVTFLDESYLDLSDWTESCTTFIKLRQAQDTAAINKGIIPLINIQRAADPGWAATSFPLVPLSELSKREDLIEGSIFKGTNRIERTSMIILTTILLIIACFNYVNLALVSGTTRLREIGVRKTFGASRKQIIRQFVFENIMITSVAFALGFVWAAVIFLPGFRMLFGYNIMFEFGSLSFWIFTTLLIFIVGILSSLYPAFYISRFRPSLILKGKILQTKSNLTKGFLSLQLVVSTICMIASMTFLLNIDSLSSWDWGYEKDQVIVIPDINDPDKLETLRNKVLSHPDVLSTSLSQYHIGTAMGWSRVFIDEEPTTMYNLGIGNDYFSTMGLKFKEGRQINPESMTDKMEYVNVNEAFIREYNLENGYDEFKFKSEDGMTYKIAGVVSDFHFYPLFHRITPVYLFIPEPDSFNHLIIKVANGKASLLNDYLKKIWPDVFPDITYRGFYQNTVFDNYLREVANHSILLSFISIISIFLSCMGLFGLISLSNTFRRKEFSIRKVLGATSWDLIMVMNASLLKLLLIVLLLALPIGYWFVNLLLEELYTYHISVGVLPLAGSSILIIAIVLVTISTLIREVLQANPAEQLAEE